MLQRVTVAGVQFDGKDVLPLAAMLSPAWHLETVDDSMASYGAVTGVLGLTITGLRCRRCHGAWS